MLAGLSLGTDLKRYSRGTLPRVALITIILLPLLYGAMYLWAFWNPFAAVDKVPVALVNSDRGTVVQGQDLRVGDQVADALLKSGQLDLHVVSAEDAAKAVAAGTYYFSITLPDDFSEAIASSATPEPRQAQIDFDFNDANNYLASVIGQNASREILNQVSAKVGEQVVGKVLIGLTDAGAGIKKAADGADQLSAGLTSANDGAHQLASGANTLAAGLMTARNGSAALAAGAGELSAGVDRATGPLIDALDRVQRLNLNPDDVAALAAQISGGVATATDRIAALNVDRQLAAGIVDQVIGGLQANADPSARGLGEVLGGAQRLLNSRGLDPTTDDGLLRLRDGAQQLQNEFDDPRSQTRQLLTQSVNGQLKSDVIKLRDGAAQLRSGATKLDAGLAKLADGGGQLAAGANQLATGTQKLSDGSRQLADGLDRGAAQVPTWTDRQRDAVARTVASPVGVQQHVANEAPTFGTGFAPFFLPLALFIGTLIIWMLLTPLQTRPIVNGLGSLRVVLASYWPALAVVACQVAIMYAVVHFGVGLHAKYTVGTIAFLFLVAATFLAMIQAFNAVFGVAVGRVVTLAFLMFQLVSSGGIYPVETTAKPFQLIHPFDPMTYAVNGLRELTVGGVESRLWVSIAVLAGVLAVSLAASSLAARRNRQYTMERLHPPIEV
ncbi:YhgE/Pip domain-containing protein [Mycolicibacterium sp.]|uniref:YhgE/Pip domain-containing protein n=1 Tax=Mycolicibacterium sp. TaxID=2320850 RepID=UPI001A2B88E0|nr:YhgE/Pip domain-containing protein [Mycolicibacterium sp.]MBJ7341839.1 YhgE/Pip domain-containing protein [Mycolicibacterium sp.]